MLLYLAAITFGAAFTGLRAVRMKRAWGGHRKAFELFVHGSSFLLAILVLIVGWYLDSVLMMGLSAIGLLRSPGTIRRILVVPNQGQEWKYQHMSSMLGAGIAAHTAFLVFGSSRFVDSSLSNSVWVWLAPTLIGVPVTMIWIRYLRRKEAPKRYPNPTPTMAMELSR